MIEIKTEKLVIKGEKKRKILDIKGVMDNEDLPTSYLKSYPRVMKRFNGWDGCQDIEIAEYDVKMNVVRPSLLAVGSIYSEEKFRELLRAVYKAGERLSLLREQEKKLKEEWKGEEAFYI